MLATSAFGQRATPKRMRSSKKVAYGQDSSSAAKALTLGKSLATQENQNSLSWRKMHGAQGLGMKHFLQVSMFLQSFTYVPCLVQKKIRTSSAGILKCATVCIRTSACWEWLELSLDLISANCENESKMNVDIYICIPFTVLRQIFKKI